MEDGGLYIVFVLLYMSITCVAFLFYPKIQSQSKQSQSKILFLNLTNTGLLSKPTPVAYYLH